MSISLRSSHLHRAPAGLSCISHSSSSLPTLSHSSSTRCRSRRGPPTLGKHNTRCHVAARAQGDSSTMAPPTLTYFGLPGRGEVARLLFTIGKVEFVDNRVTFEEWRGEGSPKSRAPFGQVPMLEVDGKALAQSPAIDRYVAHLAGLLPSDPWKAALADQAYAYMEDVMQTIYPTFKIQDADEKIKARQEIVKGALADKLTLLSKHIEARPGKYLTGDTLTHGDLAVFCSLSTLQSGWLDGVPSDLLSAFPTLKTFRNSIASLPEVAGFYAKEEDDIRVKGYRADA